MTNEEIHTEKIYADFCSHLKSGPTILKKLLLEHVLEIKQEQRKKDAEIAHEMPPDCVGQEYRDGFERAAFLIREAIENREIE